MVSHFRQENLVAHCKPVIVAKVMEAVVAHKSSIWCKYNRCLLLANVKSSGWWMRDWRGFFLLHLWTQADGVSKIALGSTSSRQMGREQTPGVFHGLGLAVA